MNHLIRAMVAVTVAFTAIFALLKTTHSDQTISAPLADYDLSTTQSAMGPQVFD